MSTWLIVGLGNPGAQYVNNRHNVGFLVVDELAKRLGTSFSNHKSNAHIAEGRFVLGGPKVVLAKPNTFMNLSGGPVANLAKYFSVPTDQIIVVHDELDLPFDALKLKMSGGHGGHNGLRDISKALATPDYIRVRVGIGRPPGRQDPANFVLSDFGSSERETLPVLVADAADAAEAIVTFGLLEAQQRVHSDRGSSK
jgi:PTH1 family peptidyl-tRNA hydrolase